MAFYSVLFRLESHRIIRQVSIVYWPRGRMTSRMRWDTCTWVSSSWTEIKWPKLHLGTIWKQPGLPDVPEAPAVPLSDPGQGILRALLGMHFLSLQRKKIKSTYTLGKIINTRVFKRVTLSWPSQDRLFFMFILRIQHLISLAIQNPHMALVYLIWTWK